MSTLLSTNYNFPYQKGFYKGKVRDVYFVEDLLIMVVTDRISAFDVILPEGIPYKGQILNEISSYFLDITQDIVPNWKIQTPDPMVMIGKKAEPFKVEMIVRGYISGSAWREYNQGNRNICGNILPENLRQNEKLPKPIVTPTTKATEGHDVNITKEEIIRQGLVAEKYYEQLEYYSLKLFERGTEYAKKRGLILVDTKYEFGLIDDKVVLIDEVHTPDSSRYFYADDYEERFSKGLEPRQLSKEFVRQWLIENGFMGRQGDKLPEMPKEFVQSVSERYIELYEILMGKKFEKPNISENLSQRIYKNILKFLYNYSK